MVGVDFAAYVRAVGVKMPQGALAMQYALRVRHWGTYVVSKCKGPKELSDAELIELDRKNGFPDKWWCDAGQ